MTGSSYEKFPEVRVHGYDQQAWSGWLSIGEVLNVRCQTGGVLVIDCYPGVRLRELEETLLRVLSAARVINVETARRDAQDLHNLLAHHLTDDRVFGVLSCHQLVEFFDNEKLQALRQQVSEAGDGLTVIYGPGAALVHPGDVLVYADLPRWEIQQRMRSGEQGNWGVDNHDEDILRRYKRAFFIEWRGFDRPQTPPPQSAHYLLDNTPGGVPRPGRGGGGGGGGGPARLF